MTLSITGVSKELLGKEVVPLVARFLAIRGLELSQEKTRITHISEGFDSWVRMYASTGQDHHQAVPQERSGFQG